MQSWLPILLIFIMLFAIIYKAYLDIKIEDPNSKATILSILAFRQYGVLTLLPLRTRANNEAERKLRRKANMILLVFYVSFAIVLLLSIFEPNK